MNRLMMFLVISTEAVFFLSLIVAFVYYSLTSGFNPQATQQLSLMTTGAFSVLLLASSFTFWRAEVSYQRGQVGGLKGWLLATIALGGIFLAGQGWEYWHLFVRDFTLSKGIFSTSFYTLTGFHVLHLLIGLIMLGVVFWLAVLGDFDHPNSSLIPTVGIYWHFVDAVWVLVFTVVYLFPHILYKPS